MREARRPAHLLVLLATLLAVVATVGGPARAQRSGEEPPAGVSAVATDPSGRGLLVTNDELWFAASCVDASGLRPLVTTAAYLSSAVVDSDGFGWLAVRGGWQPPDAPEGARVGPAPGLWKVDLDRCEIVDEIATALAPYDLATW